MDSTSNIADKPLTSNLAICARQRMWEDEAQFQARLEQLRESVKERDGQICDEYIDRVGVSDRPEFNRLLEDASEHRFDALLFWSLDELGGDGTVAALRLLNNFSAQGIRFRSWTEPDLDTTGEYGNAIIGVCRTLAKQDQILVSQRIRQGMLRARQSGTRSGRPIGRPTVSLDRATIIALREQGKSWREIAKACGAGATTVRKAHAEAFHTVTRSPD